MNLEELLAPYSPPETNFLERLRYWADAQPEAVAYRFLEGGEEEVGALTYGELDSQARAIAAKLVSMGFAGQRALMMYDSGLEFVAAFFACHYAGVVPVPAYPPPQNRKMARIVAIAENAQASVTLTTQKIINKIEERDKKSTKKAPGSNMSDRLKKIPWIATEDIPIELANDWVNPKLSNNDLGLIQYTSGSTGTPKGVMLTHENLIANCRLIARAFQISRGRPICSWLPIYHDMGLVGGILSPMYTGVEEVLMSPVAFLLKPIRWLRAISKYRTHASGGPNFAFALCTMKITPEECEGLDLTSWKVAFNGAEPVRAEVMRQFADKFEPHGFSHDAFYPCYGMAETTLIVTGGKRSEPPIIRTFNKHELVQHRVERVSEDDDNAHKLVGCGQILEEEEVLIVHPETRRTLPDDKIGEIWIHSPSCGRGYWQRDEETNETFKARLNPDNGKIYVRSGDLGFMDRGELFVAGRLKDMIIVRGVNRYPQDIEATIEQCHPLTRSGGSAAFAVSRWDREHLVIVCEVDSIVTENGKRAKNSDPRYQEVISQIASAVSLEHDLPPDAVVLVRAHSIPKTSSGKVQRHACKLNFESGQHVRMIARWSSWEESHSPEGESQPEVADGTTEEDSGLSKVVVDAVIRQVKKIGRDRAKNVNIDTNIVSLNIDSLDRLDIAQSLATAFGGRLPDDVLQDVETVREVASAIQEHIGTELVGEHAADETPQKLYSGPIPKAYYELDKMPDYLRLKGMREKIEKTGIRNPFFSVHEGLIGDTTRIDNRELISYSSYNYLALSGHPEVSETAKNAIDQFGTSVSASRIVSGEKTIHKQLEKELAEFLGVEDVITFPGGHACNESVIGHLVGKGDLILHDSLAHNSLIQGAQLSGANRRSFRHNDWRELNQILRETRSQYARILIVIEGLYSMDGDYPELPRFVELKHKYKTWLYVDEAHSIGTLGATGRGLAEVYDVDRKDVDCWMGTLSKSFGSCGGFVGGTSDLIEYLRYTTPGLSLIHI